MLVSEGPLVPQAMLVSDGPLVPQAMLVPQELLDPQAVEAFQMVVPSFGRTVVPQTAAADQWGNHAQLLLAGSTK
jgi:hypothetical protein